MGGVMGGGASGAPAAAADLAEPIFGSTETIVEPSMAGGVRRMSLAAARAQAEPDSSPLGSMYGFDASEFDDVGRVEFDVARVAGAIGMQVDARQAPLFGRVALHVVDDSRVGGHPTVTDLDDPYVRSLERSRRDAPVGVYDVGASPARMAPQRGLRLDYAQAISGALPGELEVAVEPRANVLVDGDVSGVGGGAIVRFGRNLSSPREDDKGWYAFIGADTQALTWSFGGGRRDARDLRLEDKQMIGDYQVGVARRLGEGDLSIGFVHREVKWQDASRNEQFLGVSYAVRH
jgi:hypothetical protein